MNSFLDHFASRFVHIDRDNLSLLDELYHEDILFTDPLHRIRGLSALHRYFRAMYDRVEDLHFDFQGQDLVREGEGYLRWCMSYRHPSLAGGRPVSVEGCSHLRWEHKVHWHRDYFDAGALLYEHVPVLGGAIGWLKRRLA